MAKTKKLTAEEKKELEEIKEAQNKKNRKRHKDQPVDAHTRQMIEEDPKDRVERARERKPVKKARGGMITKWESKWG